MLKLTQAGNAYSALMSRNGVDRTPYREACRRLRHEGLLEIVPRRGYLVPEVSYQSAHNLFEMRLIMLRVGRRVSSASRRSHTKSGTGGALDAQSGGD
jgi:DNA-binding GntR family transcriptional regulator